MHHFKEIINAPFWVNNHHNNQTIIFIKTKMKHNSSKQAKKQVCLNLFMQVRDKYLNEE